MIDKNKKLLAKIGLKINSESFAEMGLMRVYSLRVNQNKRVFDQYVENCMNLTIFVIFLLFRAIKPESIAEMGLRELTSVY